MDLEMEAGKSGVSQAKTRTLALARRVHDAAREALESLRGAAARAAAADPSDSDSPTLLAAVVRANASEAGARLLELVRAALPASRVLARWLQTPLGLVILPMLMVLASRLARWRRQVSLRTESARANARLKGALGGWRLPDGSTVGRTISCAGVVARASEPSEAGRRPRIEVTLVRVAPPQAGEVRIKVAAAALIEADARASPAFLPAVLGVEGAGVVESVGPGVESVRPGDHVVPVRARRASCHRCALCKSTHASGLCSALDPYTSRGVMKADSTPRLTVGWGAREESGADGEAGEAGEAGESAAHFLGCSTLAAFAVVHEEQCVRVPADAPLDKVCLLGGAVGVGWGAVWNVARVPAGATAVVFGTGTSALACVEGLHVARASRIVVVAPAWPASASSSSRLRAARDWGATDVVVLASREVTQATRALVDLTDGGADFAFVCEPGPARSALLRTALESTHEGWGTVVEVADEPAAETAGFQREEQGGEGEEQGGEGEGGGEGEEGRLAAPAGLMLAGRTLMGTSTGGWRSRRDIPELAERYSRNEVRLDRYITHAMPLTEAKEALRLVRRGECLRCVLTFPESLDADVRARAKHVRYSNYSK